MDQFFYASETPSRELLHKLIDKYPQYSHELADFALHWSLTEPTDDSILVGKDVSEEGLLSVRSKVLNTLYENSNADAKKYSLDEVSVDSVASVLGDIKGRKVLKKVSEAAGLGNNTVLLGKVLTSSIIDPPKYVIDHLSEHLDVPSELVAQCIIRNEAQPVARHFSAKGKPTAGNRETWVEAVHHLVASEDEKRRLLALAEENGVS